MNDAPLLVLRVLFGAFVTALLLYLVVLAVALPFSAPFADPPAAASLLLVAAFLAGGFWPYLVTLPLGLLALALVAPVERNIAAAEQRVVASGCATSLRAALHGTAGGDDA